MCTQKYTHLTSEQREQIDVLRRQEYNITDIAVILKRHKSTISRELKRNSSQKYNCYLSHRAHQRSESRKSQASAQPRLKSNKIRAYVLKKLKLDWSPEQIAGRLKIDHPELSISHEAIYQYIYDKSTPNREELIQYLRRSHKKRHKKGLYRKTKKTKIPNRVCIEKRPTAVEHRKEHGHWESDSIVSRASKAALNSIVERKTRLLFLSKLNRKTAACTNNAIIRKLSYLPQNARRSITFDNGTENSGHELITEKLKTDCYFAHPYHSWERGTNENTNGLVRYYLPKGTDFAKITNAQIQALENKLNSRPRKCLGFKTPFEAAKSFGVALRG